MYPVLGIRTLDLKAPPITDVGTCVQMKNYTIRYQSRSFAKSNITIRQKFCFLFFQISALRRQEKFNSFEYPLSSSFPKGSLLKETNVLLNT